jgi:type IV secretory pathway protease TraF
MVIGTGKDTPEMGKDDNSKTRVKRLRWFALGCLAGVAGVWAMCASGLRINGTGSEPVGIYWAISKLPAKGDFVFALRRRWSGTR